MWNEASYLLVPVAEQSEAQRSERAGISGIERGLCLTAWTSTSLCDGCLTGGAGP